MTVKSAERVLQLFELFDKSQRAMAFGELVRSTEWPQSSLAALLATLIDLGYLHHDYRRSTYVPTARLAHLGAWAQDCDPATEAGLLQLLRQLHDRCGETVVLAEQSGLYVRYVQVILAQRRPISTHTRTGVLRPLCASATGWALLSLQRDTEIRSVVKHANRLRISGAPPVPLQNVRERVSEARRYGFVVSRHAVKEGIGMVAMALGYPWRGRRFAIGVGAPVSHLDRRLSTIVSDMKRSVRTWEQMVLDPADDQ